MTATKESPSRFDALPKAEKDEPYFTLLARDPIAPLLVRQWVAEMQRLSPGHFKAFEALEIAADMERWRKAYDARPKAPVITADD